MIEKFVARWDDRKDELKAKFTEHEPGEYFDIVKAVVELLHDKGTSACPDPARIHVIDDGDYQGTQVYVIAETGYQPYRYWAVRVDYGSCSVCDTLQAVIYGPEDKRIEGYMTLALHIIQQLREI